MAWDATGWTYYKTLTVDQTDDLGAGSPIYQVKLLIGKTSGATGEQVDCNGHCADDFDDLRFTSNDVPASATLLNYWIESVVASGTSYLATVWVAVPMLDDAADVLIRMYYGNAGAASASSGADTFGAEKWDNFEWGANTNHLHVSGGNITWTSTDDGIVSTDQGYTGIAADTRSAKFIGTAGSRPEASFAKTNGTDYAIRFRVYKETLTVLNAQGLLWHGNGADALCVGIDASENVYYTDAAVSFVDSTLNSTADAWDLFEVNNINWTGTPTFTLVVNGTSKTGCTMYHANYKNNIVDFYGDVITGQHVWIDNVIVRKWTANEPTWSSFGAETSTGWANIAKINGIASANFSLVNGIAVANISKVNGVSV